MVLSGTKEESRMSMKMRKTRFVAWFTLNEIPRSFVRRGGLRMPTKGQEGSEGLSMTAAMRFSATC